MTNAINSDVFATVKSLEGAITALREVAKENGAEANSRKLDAYAEVIASISGIKLVKGNLPRAIGNQLREGLLEAGLKEALVKRYTENSVGALRVLNIPTQATPDLVKEILETENIASENQLAKRINGEAEKDKVAGLAEALVGKFTTRKDDQGNRIKGVFKPSDLDQADWDRFEDLVRELKAARVAAADAGAIAAAEQAAVNAAANEVFNAL
jgi:hypothetical protein